MLRSHVTTFAIVFALTACDNSSDNRRSYGDASQGDGDAAHESDSPLGAEGESASEGAQSGVKRVFATADLYDANFQLSGSGTTGLDGADNICNSAAAAASLGGDWVAWLSDSSASAIDRITGSGPWYLVGAQIMVFTDKAGIANGPLVPISVAENGSFLSSLDSVWTGTAVTGEGEGCGEPDGFCGDWTCAEAPCGATDTAIAGVASALGDTWTYATCQFCDVAAHLICLEQ